MRHAPFSIEQDRRHRRHDRPSGPIARSTWWHECQLDEGLRDYRRLLYPSGSTNRAVPMIHP